MCEDSGSTPVKTAYCKLSRSNSSTHQTFIQTIQVFDMKLPTQWSIMQVFASCKLLTFLHLAG